MLSFLSVHVELLLNESNKDQLDLQRSVLQLKSLQHFPAMEPGKSSLQKEKPQRLSKKVTLEAPLKESEARFFFWDVGVSVVKGMPNSWTAIVKGHLPGETMRNLQNQDGYHHSQPTAFGTFGTFGTFGWARWSPECFWEAATPKPGGEREIFAPTKYPRATACTSF